MKRLSDLLLECGATCMAIGAATVDLMVTAGVERALAENTIVNAMLVAHAGGRLQMANEMAARWAPAQGTG